MKNFSFGEDKESKPSLLNKLFKIAVMIGIIAGIGWLLFAPDEEVVIETEQESTKEEALLSKYLETINVVLYEGVTVSYYTPQQGGNVNALSGDLIPEYSCAVDPTVIPFASTVIVDGQGYRANDTGEFTKSEGNEIIIGVCTNEKAGIVFDKTILVITAKE